MGGRRLKISVGKSEVMMVALSVRLNEEYLKSYEEVQIYSHAANLG